MFTAFERIRARLPPLEGNAGNYLQVGPNEEECVWSSGSDPTGGVAFADIVGTPDENPALHTVLKKKADVSAVSRIPFTLGCDENGFYVDF